MKKCAVSDPHVGDFRPEIPISTGLALMIPSRPHDFWSGLLIYKTASDIRASILSGRKYGAAGCLLQMVSEAYSTHSAVSQT